MSTVRTDRYEYRAVIKTQKGHSWAEGCVVDYKSNTCIREGIRVPVEGKSSKDDAIQTAFLECLIAVREYEKVKFSIN